MEEDGEIDGYHQPLLTVPSHRSKLEADGTIWGETFDRYQAKLHNGVCRWKSLILHVTIGTLFRASQFLSEELPIRLAHRVQELGDLPDSLNEMPSIKKVQDWYAQSFEVGKLGTP